MTTKTLLSRICKPSHMNYIEKRLEHLLEGLDVQLKILGVVADRWVQLDISGEDEAVALNLVSKEYGFCPVSFANLKKYETLNGYVANFEKSDEELTVDVGIFEPQTICANVSLQSLQAQLADGKKLSLEEISELFGFCENLPISVKVRRPSENEKSIEAELAWGQVEKYKFWRESLLDRLIVIGATHNEVKRSVDFAQLTRDVLRVESLGTFEHVLACKLGTDAAGIVSKVGRNLRNARLAVFNPRKINNIIEQHQS